MAEQHTQGPRCESPVKPLLFLLFTSKSHCLYDISDIHANSRGHIFSSLPLKRCASTCLLLACHPQQILLVTPLDYHLHNARDYSSFWYANCTAFLPRTPASCLLSVAFISKWRVKNNIIFYAFKENILRGNFTLFLFFKDHLRWRCDRDYRKLTYTTNK